MSDDATPKPVDGPRRKTLAEVVGPHVDDWDPRCTKDGDPRVVVVLDLSLEAARELGFVVTTRLSGGWDQDEREVWWDEHVVFGESTLRVRATEAENPTE